MSARSYSVALGLFVSIMPSVVAQSNAPRAARAQQRHEEFYRTRAYPAGSIPAGARAAAVAAMERMMVAERKLHGNVAAGPAWTAIGPRPTNTLAEYGPGGGGLPYS